MGEGEPAMTQQQCFPCPGLTNKMNRPGQGLSLPDREQPRPHHQHSLSPPGGDKESWWSVLGVPFDAPLHAAEAAYRELVLVAHPDRGGTADAMSRLNIAISEVRLLLRIVGDD